MSETSQLDWAKFSVDKMTAAVDAKTKLMAAEADYCYRMMEVLEKRVKVEADKLQLRKMVDAFRDFKWARSRLLRAQRKAERELVQTATNARRVANLARGELLPLNLVSFAWIGLAYFLNAAPIELELELAELAVDEDCRKGANFSYNLSRGLQSMEVPDSMPDTVRHVRQVIDFLRTRNLMPRLGTALYALLLEVVVLLSEVTEEKTKAHQQRLNEVQSKLTRLRAADWKTVDIDMESPASLETDFS